MGLVRIFSVGAAAFVAVSSAAFAQQAHTGTITEVNRLNNTIAIRPTQNGTVGANANGASEQFKVGSGVALDSWHAGDHVSYSASGDDSAKTITKIDRSKPGAQ
ncbi:copper-binding protein [Bradyrhizobium sp.]|uniref:copper-binding protein n=1 Tax=Bradyrhizobium sp. TaxID=376 RepID=UPI00260CBA71|nr:copper-binding protein [Bradyrhizobium sp.]